LVIQEDSKGREKTKGRNVQIGGWRAILSHKCWVVYPLSLSFTFLLWQFCYNSSLSIFILFLFLRFCYRVGVGSMSAKFVVLNLRCRIGASNFYFNCSIFHYQRGFV